MQITILAVGNKMPDWVSQAVHEYSKRFGRDIQFSLKEIKPQKRGSLTVAQSMAIEEERIRAALPEKALKIILDEKGKNTTSVGLSEYMQRWLQEGLHPCFVIGGADGISPPLKADADLLLRISDFTLPHGMVRVVLTEQLYRAYSILNNHPYHRV